MSTLSYWERESIFKDIDLAIIGSGIVGISAAIEYKKAHPNHKVLVLERGSLPSGASSKNAGFACFGSVTELLSDLEKISEDTVLNLVDKRNKGLTNLRSLIGDDNLSFKNWGGYELFRTNETDILTKALDKMDYLNKILAPIVGENVFSKRNEKINAFGFDQINGLIFNQYEGQIDTGKMIFNLIEKAKNMEITILNGVTVAGFEDNGSQVDIKCEDFTFPTNKLIVATNGFAKKILPEIDIEPARAQVLITKPIENLAIKGTFHYEQGYYYFRNIGNRILLGGGRNLDFITENTSQIETTELIQNKLEELLSTIILPNTKHEVEMRWAGIMGVGSSKETIVKPISENVFCAIRMGGMGVAIGSLIGKEVVTDYLT